MWHDVSNSSRFNSVPNSFLVAYVDHLTVQSLAARASKRTFEESFDEYVVERPRQLSRTSKHQQPNEEYDAPKPLTADGYSWESSTSFAPTIPGGPFQSYLGLHSQKDAQKLLASGRPQFVSGLPRSHSYAGHAPFHVTTHHGNIPSINSMHIDPTTYAPLSQSNQKIDQSNANAQWPIDDGGEAYSDPNSASSTSWSHFSSSSFDHQKHQQSPLENDMLTIEPGIDLSTSNELVFSPTWLESDHGLDSFPI